MSGSIGSHFVTRDEEKECNVTSAADLKEYEKVMRIDCVILEPVEDE